MMLGIKAWASIVSSNKVTHHDLVMDDDFRALRHL